MMLAGGIERSPMREELPILRRREIILPHCHLGFATDSRVDKKLQAGEGRVLLLGPQSDIGTLVELEKRAEVHRMGNCVFLRGLARVRVEPGSRRGWGRFSILPEEPVTPAALEIFQELRKALRRHIRGMPVDRRRHSYHRLLHLVDPHELADRLPGHVEGPSRRILLEPTLEGRLSLALHQLRKHTREAARRYPPFRTASLPVGAEVSSAQLLVWSRYFRFCRNAYEPSSTTRPHPLLYRDVIIMSFFSPGVVCAVAREGGTSRWKSPLLSYGGDPPCLAGERLLVGDSRSIRCLDVANGRRCWSFRPVPGPGEWIYSSPIAGAGAVYFGDRKGFLHCRDLESGHPRWAIAQGASVNATSLFLGDRVLAASNDGFAFAYSADIGRPLWRTHLGEPCIGEVMSVNGMAVFQAGSNLLWLCPNSGEVLHVNRWPGLSIGTVCVCRDVLLAVVSPRDPRLDQPAQCVGLSAGRILYTVPAPRFTHGLSWSPDTGLAYETSDQGLTILDPRTGQRLVRVDMDVPYRFDAPPSVAEGRIYLLAAEGHLYAMQHPQL